MLPSPKVDASADILVSLLRLYKAIVGSLVKQDLISGSSFSCGVPQTHWLSFCTKLKGLCLAGKMFCKLAHVVYHPNLTCL